MSNTEKCSSTSMMIQSPGAAKTSSTPEKSNVSSSSKLMPIKTESSSFSFNAGRAGKRLKCSEPDLTIIVGGLDAEQETFHYHSIVMAMYSSWIDNEVATPTATTTGIDDKTVIRINDVEADDWEDMMGFIQDPVQARSMAYAEALKYAPIYSKYDFHTGVALCCKVLEAEIIMDSNNNNKNNKAAAQSNDKWDPVARPMELLLLADKHGFMDLYELCVDWFQKRLRDPRRAILLFSVKHLQKLAPFVAKEPRLREQAFCNNDDDDNDNEKDHILSPLWPKYFLAQSLLSLHCHNHGGENIQSLTRNIFGDLLKK